MASKSAKSNSAHKGYTLVPRWIRGFPGRWLSCAVSRSGVMHAWEIPSGEMVTRCERLGLTVKVWDWSAAFHVDGPQTVVSRFETELALAVPESGPEGAGQ